MTDRRRFMKTVTGAAAAVGVPVGAIGGPEAGRAAAMAVEDDLEGAGLGFAADGIRLKGGRPAVTILVGRDETRRVIRPGIPVRRGRARRTTFLGPAQDTWWEWADGEYRWRFTIARLERRNGLTLRASFHNASRDAVRVSEFTCAERPTGR